MFLPLQTRLAPLVASSVTVADVSAVSGSVTVTMTAVTCQMKRTAVSILITVNITYLTHTHTHKLSNTSKNITITSKCKSFIVTFSLKTENNKRRHLYLLVQLFLCWQSAVIAEYVILYYVGFAERCCILTFSGQDLQQSRVQVQQWTMHQRLPQV